nr:PaaI family thioesterase [Aestuariivirga litoralis]
MKLVAVGDGFADMEAQPSYEFYNPAMRLHGGYLASLLDSAMGSAVVSKLPAGQGLGTVQLSVNYVRKVDVESGLLHVHATALHSGRTMLTAEGQLKDAKGRLCVHATGTFLVYPK